MILTPHLCKEASQSSKNENLGSILKTSPSGAKILSRETMSDQYREVETVGYFTRLKNSIFGIFLGIVLFVASFGVLYWNEGRVDLSKVAQTSVEIPGTG
ncbi:MAG: hypothetical protein ACK559_13305, partial [bacterium]